LEQYDIGIIGAGPGGYVAALYAARLGKSVAVCEKESVGGVCLNKGCIPTKTLLASTDLIDAVKNSGSFGIDVPSYTVRFDAIKRRKEEVVQKLRRGIEELFKARKITLITGAAALTDARTIDVAGRRIALKDIIIATGSRPAEISAFRFNHRTILSSDDILEASDVPESLIVIGGGAIGCEFAALYTTLGSKVTILEMMDEIVPGMDRETAKRLHLILNRKGIQVLTRTKVERLAEKEGAISAVLSSGKELSSGKALVCVGRTPNYESIGLETVGIRTEKGKILVDGHMRTNIDGVYAIGDVVGKYLLAHVASAEGVIAARNICGEQKAMDYTSVPNCLYTSPEVAGVGMTEEQAKSSGVDYKVARFSFAALGKASAAGKTEGYVKIIGDRANSRILGVHILGADATNLIAEATLAIRKGFTIAEVSETIHAHPTLSEGLMEAAHVFEERGIHSL